MSKSKNNYRESELKKLEVYERVLLKRSLEGDSTAIDRLLKLSEVRIKLLGLNQLDESKKLQNYLNIATRLIDRIFKESNDPISIELAMNTIDELRLEGDIPIDLIDSFFETITKRQIELGNTTWIDKLNNN